MTCLDVVLGAGFGVWEYQGQCWVLISGLGVSGAVLGDGSGF